MYINMGNTYGEIICGYSYKSRIIAIDDNNNIIFMQNTSEQGSENYVNIEDGIIMNKTVNIGGIHYDETYDSEEGILEQIIYIGYNPSQLGITQEQHDSISAIVVYEGSTLCTTAMTK